ncbi:GntR family transcriptional regulator/MocR family aminotransferase [Lutibacter sp. Hel_I_33_5]|uniref:MocR-like pyridoxine biosynthesis transcription factor PdxR n=1 Tax=Lutibacter sp. Hel_I_33_5 TaxID=1566289 RepID=UPI0011A74834|nr:PLP-dependent aminotransferase family protein [Lutibacter sp. Hel_I_33_5]TVZ55568.1 GntR family transcriptional regulator/MocR family aminotransferase [Lutibacter sp. Hel_I_33_5]
MFPYKTSFLLKRNTSQALYLQLSNQFITLIKNNTLPSNTKLPGSRVLAEMLNVHRKTVVACYEELLLQGWIVSIPKKGTFVNTDLPLLHYQKSTNDIVKSIKSKANFSFKKSKILERKTFPELTNFTVINDGVSDHRLTPIDDIARTYRRIASKKSTIEQLTYKSTYGNIRLREALVSYLNETRGLQITIDNILITRGSQMGIFLTAILLFKKDDLVVVGETNYIAADVTFSQSKAKILRVPVDENGLNTDAIEKICKKKRIKAVFVTSHHHHPTTVTLSAKRRIHLLNLSKLYNFAIIEDDYDYDFNYNHAPILPLSSHDSLGNVIYLGSVCKTVAPVFRIGYLIAPKDFVDEAAKHRRYIDRQGDALLELTFAEFIKSGDLDRHIKKVLKIYRQRRDLFCKLMTEELSAYFSFEVPKGGMAVWTILDKKYTWKQVSETAKRHQLEIGDWERYDLANNNHNAIRIGFASYTEDEIIELVKKLKQTMNSLDFL